MCSRGKMARITSRRMGWEIYKQFLREAARLLVFFSWQRGRPYPWKVNKERWGFTFLFTKLFPAFIFLFIFFGCCCCVSFSPSILPPLRLAWLRRYLELLTLCANIAYNVTLNMQIGTAQHLISHLSVKVPSVGSPGGPWTDVTASARQKHGSGGGGEARRG